jgi:hypothetical protein
VFQDPDFGALMVRVTDGNTNPKQLNGYFRNPETETNARSADGRKFFLLRPPELVFVQNDPDDDFVQSDPRYRAIIKAIACPGRTERSCALPHTEVNLRG